MTTSTIYQDIAARTNGNIYIGVVGPVRTGKSTFIQKFMEELVLPGMTDASARARAGDEMPQSAAGKTVMTTEPKFVPEEAVTVQLYPEEELQLSVKMIDCVGYMVEEALGGEEDGKPRMVRTPWSEDEMPFEQAAEMGTEKVIREHATVGVVVTTDGSIGDIPRGAYEKAEERVVYELKALGKPFALVLNSARPEAKEAAELAIALEEKYGVPVALVNCMELSREDIGQIMGLILSEFPLVEVGVQLPGWIMALPGEHSLKRSVLDSLTSVMKPLTRVGEVEQAVSRLQENENIRAVRIGRSDLGQGSVCIALTVDDGLYYRILSDLTGFAITGEEALMDMMRQYADMKKRYDKVEKALNDVYESGYGIVMPGVEEMHFEEPEIVKTSGSFGVKLRTTAPSIHMIRANIETELSPIVGSEEQSEDMVKYLKAEYEEDPARIWESNMFGKSLHDLVSEGLDGKLDNIPKESQEKLSETLERILNEGANGLICILL